MGRLYKFQEDAVEQLLLGKHFIIAGVGSGKTAMAMSWAEHQQTKTGKTKLLVVTTASKSRTGDFEQEADVWTPQLKEKLDEFSVISWHKLSKWTNANYTHVKEYIVIFDECLPADTLVRTDKGEKKLATLSLGDKVLSYNHEKKRTELKAITRTIKKKAPTTMYRLLLSNGTVIISTGNHPHWTQNGYMEAKDIKQGDILYEMRDVWENHRRDDVKEIPQGQTKSGEEDILFERMREKGDKRKWEKGDGEPRSERKIEAESNRANENEQPVAGQGTSEKGITDEEREWLASDMGVKSKLTGWQRKLFRTAKIAMEKTKRGEQRVGDGTASISGGMGTWVSQELQIRHRQFLPQNRNRVRWQQPQFGKDKSERQEEGEEIRRVRVESVEVLKLGDIKRLGLYRDADNVYCIDVEDNHNFFANGVLTHNCQRAKAGVSSGMGRAFLKITKLTKDWAAFTGTPGDTWLSFYPYMTACGMILNKTAFLYKFASVQTYKGYPEIVGWRNEDELKSMWTKISYAPDTHKVMSELPEQTHKVFTFKKPTGYSKTLKTRLNGDGEFLDTPGALCAELRRQCFTKDKQEWVKDFVDGLESGCVFFYNFIKTGDMLEEIMKKALPKDAKIWRIDGKHHEIPTAETIGKKDMVLCQWQSGSEALNLQFLHYWVAVELCYSYSTANQARGRIRRLGQKHPQWYGYLLTESTIEQDILKCLKGKSEFSEKVWCASNNIEIKE